MELNPQNTQKLSEQVRCSSSDDHGGPGPVRSYTCAFCKRGFSNAQALGGHMNIHRRDRAKLKQSSEENLLSLDISIKNPSSDHHEPHHPSSEEKILPQSCTIADHENDDKFAHGLQRSKVINVASELTQLPISGEIASIASNNNERIEEKKIEIDLELRLGPEPHEAPTLSTREFF